MRLGRGNCLQTHNIRELKSMCIILYLHDIVLVFTYTCVYTYVYRFNLKSAGIRKKYTCGVCSEAIKATQKLIKCSGETSNYYCILIEMCLKIINVRTCIQSCKIHVNEIFFRDFSIL